MDKNIQVINNIILNLYFVVDNFEVFQTRNIYIY